ncbi:MAG: YbhB/YbcL family Raf kinase inhibitor-like protein [Myxococcales bacterium]
MALSLESPDFRAGGPLPARCAADTSNRSPALLLRGAPAGTRSFALVVEDPDAPEKTWVHWLAWNIPSERREIPEAVGPDAFPQGLNDYGQVGWGGPKPPRGDGAHRYVFRLYALDALLDLPQGATRDALEGRLHGHVLARATLTGKAWRSR